MGKTKNQFVVVLVDGDGAKFCDDLLNEPDPAFGAQKAAENLKKAVRDHLRQENLSEDITIIVRVFAHVSGLAKALTESDIIPQTYSMFTFAEKFTNACAEFDFVNVGWGKENADSKIRSKSRCALVTNHWHPSHSRCSSSSLTNIAS
ncbi:hypothetical protein SLS62_001906 [Diatrype stigma]|uniref:DUF7923 domain-containing protein n=1 Tax=Diatrype stigma TaxID=117547 RepID=A0AAN9UUU9_9PEZI